jgi:hypothetical protein
LGETHLSAHAIIFRKLAFIICKSISHPEIASLLLSVTLVHGSFSGNSVLVAQLMVGIVDPDVVVPVQLLVRLVIAKSKLRLLMRDKIEILC